ncbi:hypothetical protein [Solimonas sp. SE-A11]|uniref:hypothetical protein n=1 Tax=Solimonas sp. SE-A11 TaxID=3054954 RepID=UPI00259CDC4C|nr:hypothetical protein [Solimonas sp. SE-A11]MDM4772927.1 hypothetical protein [Solimonas sp. SE-A11]
MRERQDASFKKQRRARIAAVYAATASTLLGINALYEGLWPKSHDLAIQVSDLNIDGDVAEYGVAFYNNGGYHEVIADAKSMLGQTVEGYENTMNWQQDHCFHPVVLEPGKAAYVRYVTKFALDKPEYRAAANQQQKYQLILVFDVLSPSRGVVSVPIPVGTLAPYQSFAEWFGKVAYTFRTRQVSVDFDKARPRVMLGSYPQDDEFRFSKLCRKEA